MNELIDSLPCGYLAYLDDGTIVEANSTLCTLLGYGRAEVLGWHVQKLLPGGARIFQQTHVFPMLKLHGRVDEIYIGLLTKDGHRIPTLMNAVRREREGRFVSECVFLRMTQRNEWEEQVVMARRIAEEANAAKAKFLSMMSHDLRTPLHAINGFTTILRRGIQGPLTAEQQLSVDRIGAASRDLMRLINDILSFATVESGNLDVQIATVLVREAIERAENLIRLRLDEAGLSFSWSAAGDLAVLADADRLQQVLLNLLTNAIKFTRSGGTISVHCETNGDRVQIHVRDSGIGIAPEQLSRVFEPFVQIDPGSLKRADRGVGLGLSISRELVQAMNGDLRVASVVGEGSTFTVELRAAPAR
jgi:PAS domain S-box-containing protein